MLLYATSRGMCGRVDSHPGVGNTCSNTKLFGLSGSEGTVSTEARHTGMFFDYWLKAPGPNSGAAVHGRQIHVVVNILPPGISHSRAGPCLEAGRSAVSDILTGPLLHPAASCCPESDAPDELPPQALAQSFGKASARNTSVVALYQQ